MQKRRRGARPRYPWKEWIGEPGNKITLRSGKDFSCQIHGFAVQVRQRAKEFGFRVSVLINGSTVTLRNLARLNNA